MKKTIVSAILIGIFVLYCFLHAANAIAVVPTATPTSRSSSSSTPAPTSTAAPSVAILMRPSAPTKKGARSQKLIGANWLKRNIVML